MIEKTYILTEKRPTERYVTANGIEFTIEASGEIQSMQVQDDVTKIRLIKLAGDIGHRLVKEVKYTVKDITEVQKVSVTDKKTPIPGVPQTGENAPLVAVVILLSILSCAGIFFRGKRVGV